MKILLCAFDPFGGESINPALEAVRRVSFDDAFVEKLEVPTVFYKSVKAVNAKIDEIRPDAVIMIGQAGGREKITPERVAINISDAKIDDNEGNRPIDEPIEQGAPAAYFSTLPIKKMVCALENNNIPSTISNTAGTFVCNHLMYGVLHHIALCGYKTLAGFVHIPYLPEQTVGKENMPSLPLEVSVRGIELIIKAVVEQVSAE